MNPNYEELRKRVKLLEASVGNRFTPQAPVYVRLDGKNFSRFTKRFEKPFCPEFTRLMQDTAHHLMRESGAACAYTQSDEISLMLVAGEKENSAIFFDGKTQKLVSVLASMATAYFLRGALKIWGEYAYEFLPVFDARACEIPSTLEAKDLILYRSLDCENNALSNIAQQVFSSKELHKKGRDEVITMLKERGIEMKDFRPENLYGTVFRSVKRTRLLTKEEASRIPFRYRPTAPIERTDVLRDILPFGLRHVSNLEDFLFKGADVSCLPLPDASVA